MNYSSIQSPGTRKAIKTIAYEYLLYKLTDWKCGKNNLQTAQEFNEKNDLSSTHLFLSPFFTCTANGSFDFLYDLFGDFYALSDGHNSSVAFDALIFESTLDNFVYDGELDYNLKINSSVNNENFLEEIRTNILNKVIEPGVVFRDIFFDVITNPTKTRKIYEAIDTSIKALKLHTNEEFINFDSDDLTTISLQHKSWVLKYTSNPKSIDEIIISKDLVKAEDIFVYTPIASLEIQEA